MHNRSGDLGRRHFAVATPAAIQQFSGRLIDIYSEKIGGRRQRVSKELNCAPGTITTARTESEIQGNNGLSVAGEFLRQMFYAFAAANCDQDIPDLRLPLTTYCTGSPAGIDELHTDRPSFA